MIPDTRAFGGAIESGLDAATAGSLVTFGVTPDCPHTGYGYIETETSEGASLEVTRFVEKPSLAAAEAYLDSDHFYWNSGMLLFKAATMLDLLQSHAPSILEVCQKSLSEAKESLGFRVLGASYSEALAISLDYAVAEKAGDMVCIPLTTAWSDVGSWSALWNFMEKDAHGNVACGEGDIILEGTHDSFAYSDKACLALVGVKDLVVATTQDAVLVTSKANAEQIKLIVDYLKGNGYDLAVHHNRVHRPWGWYQSLNRGDRYQVKCIMVNRRLGFLCRATITAQSIGLWSAARSRSLETRRWKSCAKTNPPTSPSARNIASPIRVRFLPW
jgi:mannose-1-phosphate guanylyltransferase/mannose-6-phosphate isomerase